MLEIKLATKEDIGKSRESWNSLVSSMRLPTIFLTWEWITTWLKHFGKQYILFVLFIYDDCELKAIVPLAKRSLIFKNKLIKVNVITFCGCLELYPDHLDIICSADDTNNYAIIILDYFLYEYKDWDVMYLPYIADNGCLESSLKLSNNSFRLIKSDDTIAPFINLENGIDSCLAEMDRKKRYNLNRESKLLFDKNISFSVVNSEYDLEYGLNELFELHKERAGNKNIISAFYRDDIMNFHKEISKIFLELDWLKLYLLKNNDNNKAISAAYGFIYGQSFSYYQTGFDPEWQRSSPGKILILKILEDLCRYNVKEFDFLGGNDSYKTYWTKKYRLMSTYTIFNNNLIGRMEYFADYGLCKLKSTINSVYSQFSTIKLKG